MEFSPGIATLMREMSDGYENAYYETGAIVRKRYFKRLKSILDYGELPKKTEDSIFAWLNGKLMIALLIEKLLGRATFSPTAESFEEYLARGEDYEAAVIV